MSLSSSYSFDSSTSTSSKTIVNDRLGAFRLATSTLRTCVLTFYLDYLFYCRHYKTLPQPCHHHKKGVTTSYTMHADILRLLTVLLYVIKASTLPRTVTIGLQYKWICPWDIHFVCIIVPLNNSRVIRLRRVLRRAAYVESSVPAKVILFFFEKIASRVNYLSTNALQNQTSKQ